MPSVSNQLHKGQIALVPNPDAPGMLKAVLHRPTGKFRPSEKSEEWLVCLVRRHKTPTIMPRWIKRNNIIRSRVNETREVYIDQTIL